MIVNKKDLRYVRFFITFCQICPISFSVEKNFFLKKIYDNVCLSDFIITFAKRLLFYIKKSNQSVGLRIYFNALLIRCIIDFLKLDFHHNSFVFA